MAKILVYNTSSNIIETFYRKDNEPMPYSYNRTLLVSEFRRRSNSNLLWTTRQAIEAWNLTRRNLGLQIYVSAAFRRIFENGHANMSQHYAGVAFDCGSNLSYSNRLRLYNIATSLNVWGYVEPFYLTVSYIHMDRRFENPACTTGGYPTIRYLSRGVYVMILQDALNTLGYNSGNIDGIFGTLTRNVLINYQRNNSLQVDGICGCNSWRSITARANGIGRSSTTKD